MSLPEWSIDLRFSQFTATNLFLALSWKRESAEEKQAVPLLTKYSLKLSATLQFGDTPAAIEMEIGSHRDTILNASLNPTRVDLERTVDKTLGFTSDQSPASSKGQESVSFSDLLPTGTAPFEFTTGYLQLNLTCEQCLVFGSVKDLGSCLLLAGQLEDKSGFGYAVTFFLQSFSSLLPPLAAVEGVITVKDVNASIMNLDGVNIESLMNTVLKAQDNITELPEPPFATLPLKTENEIGEKAIVHGTSLYTVLDFHTDSALLCNLVSIQQSGKMPGDVVIYAHVTQDPTDSFFLAYIHSLTLFGLLNFIDIEFQYKYSPESTIHLTGDISVPAIAPDSKFHGSLQIGVKTADFSLTGSKQPEVLHEPLGMFGIQILSPVLRLHYDFEPFSYNYELSGSVEFYSHPDANSSDSNATTEPKKPSATLTAKCVFIEGTPKVVDISLEASESPLTVAYFVATVFNANWDMTFLNIGFYSGRLYYANIDNHKAVQSPSDTFQYKSGQVSLIVLEFLHHQMLDLRPGLRVQPTSLKQQHPLVASLVDFCHCSTA